MASVHFDEEAEEETPLVGDRNAPAMRRWVSTKSMFSMASISDNEYDASTGVAMFVNYIVGTGCFALPFAFYQAGLGFSSILLLIGALLCAISGHFTLEVMARAQGYIDYKEKGEPKNHITNQKIEFSQMAGLFGGTALQGVTQLMIFMFGTPWSYAGVFGSSLAALIFSYFAEDKCDVYHDPSADCRTAYYVILLAFGVYGIGFSMMDVSEQAGMQRFMTMYRFAAIVLMIGTMAIKLAHEWHLVPGRIDKVGWFNFAQFAAIFGPSFQALANQYNMPDLIPPLRNKADAPFVTNISFLLCAVFYTLLGFMGAIAFDRPDALVTLNWSSYTGCGSGWEKCESRAAMGDSMRKLIGGFTQILVLCFPVVNVASAYPLVCVSVGDNMCTLIPRSVRDGMSLTRKGLSRMCRFVAAILPVLVGLTFMPLDLIFVIAGLFGFILSLCIPSLLQIVSMNWCENKFGPELVATPYSRPVISSKWFAWAYFVLSCGCVILSLFTLKKK